MYGIFESCVCNFAFTLEHYLVLEFCLNFCTLIYCLHFTLALEHYLFFTVLSTKVLHFALLFTIFALALEHYLVFRVLFQLLHFALLFTIFALALEHYLFFLQICLLKFCTLLYGLQFLLWAWNTN